ncbi:SLAM family member 9 [Labeo rohita]|uniref:SLAM family member 9 n=1 Tax=Labeo rohita TaxID=84645 RepID=A0ABQ8L8V9_LABRO|nr:SLAM family member 9 [Labeo rohita]
MTSKYHESSKEQCAFESLSQYFDVMHQSVCAALVHVKHIQVSDEGKFILYTDVTEIQTDDEITWTFGTNRNVIAKISGKTSEIDDGPDGRFRDRLKLDHQIGSLTIINIKTEHAGVYEVNISRRSRDTSMGLNHGTGGHLRVVCLLSPPFPIPTRAVLPSLRLVFDVRGLKQPQKHCI